MSCFCTDNEELRWYVERGVGDLVAEELSPRCPELGGMGAPQLMFPLTHRAAPAGEAARHLGR